MTDEFRPGQIRVCDIRNLREDPGAAAKPRPAVLIYERRGTWHVMGMTMKGTYESGLPRVPVPGGNYGLQRKGGHLWGTLTALPPDAIGEWIGTADLPLIQAIGRLVKLSEDDIVSLLLAVSR